MHVTGQARYESTNWSGCVSAMNPRAVDLIQGLLIALATVLFGVALILGDITLPQSVVGGGFLVVAGLCWAIAAVLRRRHTRIPA